MSKLKVNKVKDRFPGISAYDDLRLRASLAVIGIKNVVRPSFPVYEDCFVKFCSDSGISDIGQGYQFERWLKKNKMSYDRCSERSFMLSKRAAKTVEKLWEKSDLEFERDKIDAKLKKLKTELKKL